MALELSKKAKLVMSALLVITIEFTKPLVLGDVRFLFQFDTLVYVKGRCF